MLRLFMLWEDTIYRPLYGNRVENATQNPISAAAGRNIAPASSQG
jgi:hypothetical protein